MVSACVLSHFSHVQVCVTPTDCSPPGFPWPWDSPGKNADVSCHVLLQEIFPNPGIKPASLMSSVLAGGFLPLMPPEKPLIKLKIYRTKGFPDSSVGKESACNAGDLGLIPGSGRFPGEGIGYPLQYSWASLVAQLVKNPPAMWDTWVQSLGWEYPLEKGKAIHSSILAWRIPWTV